jgi:hypothetical protein
VCPGNFNEASLLFLLFQPLRAARQAGARGLSLAPPSEVTPVESSATIVIVDDEPEAREVLEEEYFAVSRFDAIGAGSASAAKAIAASRRVDLALLPDGG